MGLDIFKMFGFEIYTKRNVRFSVFVNKIMKYFDTVNRKVFSVVFILFANISAIWLYVWFVIVWLWMRKLI